MQTSDFLKTLDKRAAQNTQQSQLQQANDVTVQNTNTIVETIAEAVKVLMRFEAQHQPKVSVTNQQPFPTSIKTPDVKAVVAALENLKQPLAENKPDDTRVLEALGKLNESINKLPTSFPEVPEPVEEVVVKNQPDYTAQFDKIDKAIQGIDVKPVVNIPEEKPDDYSPIITALTSVVEAVKSIKIPAAPIIDLMPLIDATTAVQDSIQALRFPVPNYILPFVGVDGGATQSPVSIVDKAFDDVEFTNADAGGNYQTITFNANGTTVRILNLAFDANNNVTSIMRA